MLRLRDRHPLSGRRHRGSRPDTIERVDRRLIHLGALFQDELWWDARGKGHRLTKMELTYVRNVERFLRREATEFVADAIRDLGKCEHCRPLLAGKVLPDPDAEDFDAQAWVEGTHLIAGIRKLLAEHDIEPYAEDEFFNI